MQITDASISNPDATVGWGQYGPDIFKRDGDSVIKRDTDKPDDDDVVWETHGSDVVKLAAKAESEVKRDDDETDDPEACCWGSYGADVF